MRFKTKRAWLLPLLITILSIVVVGGSLSLRFLDLDTYKDRIISQVRSALKRDLRYQSGDFSLRYGPSFTFSGLTVKEKNGVDDFIKADRLIIRIAILPLLGGDVVISRLELQHPQLELSREKDGSFNVSDLFSGQGGTPPGIHAVQLDQGRIRFTDRAVGDTPLITELSGADLYLSRLTRGKNCDVKLSANLSTGGGKVPVFLAGVAKLPAAGRSFGDCEIDGRLRTGLLDAGHFWPYYSRYLPFKSLGGGIALETTFKGRPTAFRCKGTLTAHGVDLDYPRVFHARLTPRQVKCGYQMELSRNALEVSELKLNVDGLDVKGSCRLSELHSGDPRITAKATTNRFNLAEFRQFIPYGVIVKETADFIEQKIKGGYYRLEDGRLDGRVSQILHMERGQNYNILYVKAQVEEGAVNYGSGLPVFAGLNGELMLVGKDFVLKGMTGRFGSSPLALEGRIADYPLDTPSRYLFSAALRPRQPEVAWLLGGGLGGKFSFTDGSTLRLKGEGTSSLYNLSGDWNLGQAAYSFPGAFGKPQGRPNTLSFQGSFDKEQFRLSSLYYNLAPLSLSASATSRYRGGVAVELRTNQFQAAEVAPLLPQVRKYQPAGRMQAQLHASGGSLDRLSWSGNVQLAGFSFRGSDTVKPITGVNGNLKVGADSLETSQMSVRVGSSTISGRGTLKGFDSPTVALSFYSPELDLSDLGLAPDKHPLRAEKVQGSLAWDKGRDHLQIGALSGTLGQSFLQVRGEVRTLAQPQIDIAVSSPHLEIEDLTPLFAGPSGEKRVTLKARVNAADGSAWDLPFQRLKCLATVQDKVLYLQPCEFSTMEGEASGKMKVDFSASGPPRYQVNATLQHASADRILRALGAKRQEMSGSVFLSGDISSKGESAQELRRSAQGALKVKVERGSIRRLATLSKIFSILNVSQLFKLQLPEMVSGGMPYNKITGDFLVRDGVAYTQNLFMDSNAINVSAVGKFDLPRDQLELNIGAQPLQTVDKVVSHIPIVGWILTGKDRSLITTYFEAKGKIEDPQVTAVPVKSLAKGAFNIFKRVFELPAHLITDTGEVIK